VSLTTTENRVRCNLALPEAEDGYKRQYLDSDEWSVTESTLTARDGDCLLHIGFRRPKNDTERNTAENGTVLGVDVGIENLAVTSTAYFFNGRELTHDLREFEKVRAGLQQTGTRSAHRTLEQSGDRELRYVRDELHQASNAIVDEALRYECDVIAFEDLTHIRDRTGASWGHKWAFRTLYEQVEYKAEAVDVSVMQVGSAYTSTRCAECGFTAEENRPTRNDFRCQKCGTEANADYNAAKNTGDDRAVGGVPIRSRGDGGTRRPSVTDRARRWGHPEFDHVRHLRRDEWDDDRVDDRHGGRHRRDATWGLRGRRDCRGTTRQRYGGERGSVARAGDADPDV
jgi:IS605 OrfB family transposase